MNRTPIEWTDFSANPVRFRAPDGRVVWACEKLSPGCANCYAEDLSHRYGGSRRAGDWNAGTMATLTPFLDEAELRKMLTYKPAAGKRCFVGDMTDIFGAWVSDELLDRLFAVFALRQSVTWQVLTKRADRMRAYFDVKTPEDLLTRWADAAITIRPLGDGEDASEEAAERYEDVFGQDWPLPNVWLGVSVENQRFADERIPLLLQTPASVRFISAEPLLGPVDLTDQGHGTSWLSCTEKNRGGEHCCMSFADSGDHHFRGVDWVIVGGESGADARPFDIAWGRSIVKQCQAASVPVFVKQLGASPSEMRANFGEHENHAGHPHPLAVSISLHDRKGGVPSEWPNDLRVREFPTMKGDAR
jgi:protein gp37